MNYELRDWVDGVFVEAQCFVSRISDETPTLQCANRRDVALQHLIDMTNEFRMYLP